MRSSSSALEFAAKRELPRREPFLREIDAVTPWSELIARVELCRLKAGGRGRPPIGLPRMPRMYAVHQCLRMSADGIEDAVYDSQAIRGFVGISLARQSALVATTRLRLRRLLETRGLTRLIFEVIKARLNARGQILREGTAVDAAIVSARSSTKNDSGTRAPICTRRRRATSGTSA